MHIVYYGEKPPETVSRSIFLAGPTPRQDITPSWRPDAIAILERIGYDGVVFVPESRDGKRLADYTAMVEWEESYLHMADCIAFWIPRNMDTMPALTTNVEWGVWYDSGKVVLGAPADAMHVRYEHYYAKKQSVPIADTLEGTMRAAIYHIGEGVPRMGGEREVPLYIWKTQAFRQWYKALLAAGNRLDGARVEWVFRVGPQKKAIFLWALHVNIFVAAEGRNKTNEFVMPRTDISAVLMYRRREDPLDTEVVLIREYRSPVSNETGFVWELPGGSTFKDGVDPQDQAIAEFEEEAGIAIDLSRLRSHGARQVMATLSAHKAHLFSIEMTDNELADMRSKHGIVYGVRDDTERTYVEVLTIRDILARPIVDWSMLGMILSIVR